MKPPPIYITWYYPKKQGTHRGSLEGSKHQTLQNWRSIYIHTPAIRGYVTRMDIHRCMYKIAYMYLYIYTYIHIYIYIYIYACMSSYILHDTLHVITYIYIYIYIYVYTLCIDTVDMNIDSRHISLAFPLPRSRWRPSHRPPGEPRKRWRLSALPSHGGF